MYTLQEQIAWKTLSLLVERKALLANSGIAFYVFPRDGRIVVAFDPSAIALQRVNDDFAHQLSTRLHGRVVVRTNTRGMFLQVGPAIPLAAVLDTSPLDFSQQETPYHMPIGVTGKGAYWISLTEGDSFLVGGSRGSGKSGVLHGMIQALLNGGKAEVYATDGPKQGVDFGRYLGKPNYTFLANVRQGLETLSVKLAVRLDALRESGYSNILQHNEAGRDFLAPIALFVDEIAALDDDTKELLKRMIELYRAAGLYPVLATNAPTQAAVLTKTNLTTRIALRVPSIVDSLTILGYKGAESLPQSRNQPGRGLLVVDGKLTEFQAYRVSYPMITDSARALLASQFAQETSAQAGGKPVGKSAGKPGIEELAESIREKWNKDMSRNAVARLFDQRYAGAWAFKVDKIFEYLASTTTEIDAIGDNQPD